MIQAIDMEAIRRLSVAQRMALIARIWDTLAQDDAVPVSDAVLDEMERRAAQIDADPSVSVSHEEMTQRLQKLL